MYADLNVAWPITTPSSALEIQTKLNTLVKTVEELVQAGFTLLALNQVVHPPYPSIQRLTNMDFGSVYTRLQSHVPSGHVQWLKRITLVVDDDLTSFHHFLRTTWPTYQQQVHFDVWAVCPGSEKSWQYCCTELPCDLISLDTSSKLSFYLKPSLVNEAQRRGVGFEITFASALKDDTSKRNLISNARNLIRVTHGKGVILSSGASHWLDTRGVLDIINLGCLFGMPMHRAKHAITVHPRAVLMHAIFTLTMLFFFFFFFFL
ncbi:Ribonuclease P protein subunit p30 [Coelomomyces lativittatus]|nr:Ribonuclease P protein subunit p30 [Coelomomyces lativittatus]